MDVISYLNFDLQIQRAGDDYRAQVQNSPKGQATTDFRVPFNDNQLENFLLRVGRTRRLTRRLDSPEVKAAKEFGSQLFSALFKDDVRDCLLASLNLANDRGVGLRIRLRLTDTPELIDIPWEYLYNPNDDFLALSNETPVVRYLEFTEEVRPLTVSPPLRILVCIASPTDLNPLDVTREWSNLRTALRPLEQRGLLTLERTSDGTLDSLRKRLQGSQYHILHFIGHGHFDEQSSSGVLAFEDKFKRTRRVSGEDLGRLLRDHRSMRIAVLNACEGARADRSDPFAGTAQSLIRKKIPAVIAMQFEITDEAAITFAIELYGALTYGYPVDAALAEARKAIFVQGNGLEWGTPVLYLRSRDGYIFDVEQTVEMRLEMRNWELYENAVAAMARQEYEIAIERFELLVRINPTDTKAREQLDQARKQEEINRLYSRIKELVELEKWTEAAAQLEQLQTVAPTFKDTPLLIARVQSELEESKVDDAPERTTAKKPNAQIQPYEKTIEADRLMSPPQPVSPTQPPPDLAYIGATLDVHNAQPRRKLKAVWIVVFLAATVVGIFTLLLKLGDKTPSNFNRPVVTLTEVPAQQQPVAPTPPAGMVYVPGGPFKMGRDREDGGEEYEHPLHDEQVDSFFIDMYEVTCKRYQKFLKAIRHRSPPGWRGTRYPAGWDKQPVTGVTLSDATAYAEWRSKTEGGTYRIPTEKEWEFAARGNNGRRYPWGKDWDASLANLSGKISDVGKFKGESPYRAIDMVGNVWEWTTSVLQPYPGNDVTPKSQELRYVIRGGAFDTPQPFATTSYRGGLPPESSSGYMDYGYSRQIGFRCVKNVFQ